MKPNWDRIKKTLELQDYVMYYVGGTLCIDFPEGGLIGLNLAGTWFVSVPGGRANGPGSWPGDEMPPDILELVKKTYLKEKGETAHYILQTGELASA